MKFYSINSSLDKKKLGNSPQVKSYKYHCDIWDDPKFIEQVIFKEVNFEPITANAILHPKSKVTDLIDAGGIGFTLKPLISNKLKRIIENSRKTGIQFFKSPIIQANNIIDNYWVLNMYEIGMNLIDFSNSTIVQRIRKNEGGTALIDVKFDSLEDFIKELNDKKLEGKLYFKSILIKNNTKEDFFLLRYVEGGAKYVVSDKLKKEIEDAGCTGIEFQPVELSLNEWLHDGHREKVYGKA